MLLSTFRPCRKWGRSRTCGGGKLIAIQWRQSKRQEKGHKKWTSPPPTEMTASCRDFFFFGLSSIVSNMRPSASPKKAVWVEFWAPKNRIWAVNPSLPSPPPLPLKKTPNHSYVAASRPAHVCRCCERKKKTRLTMGSDRSQSSKG